MSLVRGFSSGHIYFAKNNRGDGGDDDDWRRLVGRDNDSNENDVNKYNNNKNNNSYAFVVNAFKNLFAPLKGALTVRQSKTRRKQLRRVKGDQQLSDSFFFPDKLQGGGVTTREGIGDENRRVLRKKDFLQLFGDKSKAKLEPPWRCVFFGSDHFSVQVLQLLHGTGMSLVPGEGLLCVLDVCTQVGRKGKNWHGTKFLGIPCDRFMNH